MALTRGFARREASARKAELDSAALRGARVQASQRIQLGIAGIGAMLLLVALASTIMEQAREAEDPQIAAQEGAEAKANRTDPLVDIGVVPELPAEGEGDSVRDLPAADLPPPQAAPSTPPTGNRSGGGNNGGNASGTVGGAGQ
ncbi:hypothetical protein [Croceicoccus sp. YJ47]|uniref:hypothetical protein n=1 Tax=Croceicoccus sp. YJ47 TaxID=2798724 RepID=UPI001920E958|nr:hypothetical protein [Croceicoccus sp. YJ47]QQN74759.1 hypothetical protein JD971_03240 [Croceicoccus sp. YJ47]